MKKNEGGKGVESESPEAMPPSSPHRNRGTRLIPFVCLLVLITGLFSYTVTLRTSWFGTLALKHHQWLTGSTLKFAKNWYREGAGNLRFLMLENPRSVEFPSVESRGIYPSYPPGALLPLLAISRLTDREPTAAMVMEYNLANHYLVALSLAVLVYLLLVQIPLHAVHAALFATIPPIFVLFMPGPLYWFQNVYFTDQAIILPFVLLLLTEVIGSGQLSQRQRRLLYLGQGALLCYGFLTDWLFVFVSVVVYGKRLLMGEIPLRLRDFLQQSLLFWAGPALGIGLFAWQLTSFHQWSVLGGRFLLRTGVSDAGKAQLVDFYQRFWRGFVTSNFGSLATYLLWGSLIAVGLIALSLFFSARQRARINVARERSLLAVMAMAVLPCFIQIYALRNHCWEHDFSPLKLIIPLSLVPFVLLPVWILVRMGQYSPQVSRRLLGVNILGILLTLAVTLPEYPRYKTLFPQPYALLPQIGAAFEKKFSYNDIVISPTFEILPNPPQLLAYTMKRVYRITSAQDLKKITAGIKEPFQIVQYEPPKDLIK